MLETYLGNGFSSNVVASRRIHTREEMPWLLHRERQRADRTGLPLAIVIFSRSAKSLGDYVDLLTDSLAQRLRLTDEIGNLDDEHVVAVLPATPRAGGHRVGDDVVALPALRHLKLTFEVLVYPEPPSNGKPRRIDRRQVEYSHPAASEPSAGFLDEVDAQDLAAPFHRHDEVLQGAEGRASHGETIKFVQALPLWKRAIDMVGSIVLIMLLMPLLLIVAAIIKADSPGPVVFRQRRSGLGGRPFWMLKFRTMVERADRLQSSLRQHSAQDGPAFKMENDPRVTAIGGLLRRVQHRRIAATLECARWRDVAGGAPALALRRDTKLRSLASPPAGCDSRDHLHLAGRRAIASVVRRVDADGPAVYRITFVSDGSETALPNDFGRRPGNGQVIGPDRI